jgi:cytochrome c-type biogenesis protein
MPLALALVAGGLATINPCGFALLPALLSFYVGAEDKQLPKAPTRLVQGLVVGLVVSAGFLLVFALVGIPISLGAREVTEAIPWAGVILGAAMALVGLWVLLGKSLSFPIYHSMTARRERRPRAMFLFGVGYGIASLGCTLPVFLALIGASLASRGPLAGLAVFGSYAFGMATVLMALSLGAALLRVGLARALKRLLPYMHRISGAFLVMVGAYLAYYWSTALFAPIGRLSSDPLVSFVQRFTNRVQTLATSGGGRWLILTAGFVVAVTAAIGMWQWSKRAQDGESRGEEPAAEAGLPQATQRVELGR